MRFTKGNRQKVLNDNEGFSTTTSYSGRNFQDDRTYSIADGKLSIRAKGKTAWADSRFDDTNIYGADDEETKRFLRRFRDQLNLEDE